jgi:hypothetical protein
MGYVATLVLPSPSPSMHERRRLADTALAWPP